MICIAVVTPSISIIHCHHHSNDSTATVVGISIIFVTINLTVTTSPSATPPSWPPEGCWCLLVTEFPWGVCLMLLVLEADFLWLVVVKTIALAFFPLFIVLEKSSRKLLSSQYGSQICGIRIFHWHSGMFSSETSLKASWFWLELCPRASGS